MKREASLFLGAIAVAIIGINVWESVSSPAKAASAFSIQDALNSRIVHNTGAVGLQKADARLLHAARMISEFAKNSLSGSLLKTPGVTPFVGSNDDLDSHTVPFNLERRYGGLDWPLFGATMIGHLRLDNLRDCIFNVIEQQIVGDIVETGVWRGGAMLFAALLLEVLTPLSTRRVWLCDSFSGLPPASTEKDTNSWVQQEYLRVPSSDVAELFDKSGIPADRYMLLKGYFNETMPQLASKVDSIAVLRFDADMWESAMDVFCSLYGRVPLGGFIIVDDWFGFPSREAIEGIFADLGVQEAIIPIDTLSVFWRKNHMCSVQESTTCKHHSAMRNW